MTLSTGDEPISEANLARLDKADPELTGTHGYLDQQ